LGSQDLSALVVVLNSLAYYTREASH